VLVIGKKTTNFTVMPQYRFPRRGKGMKPFRLRHNFMIGGASVH
jgi:hypothetical protein